MILAFDNSSGKLTKIEDVPFKLEKELQILVEPNTKTIFGIDFVRTQFPLKGLRFDSLCFDKKINAFVIIEYKKEQNYSAVDQGKTYRKLLLENQAELILSCNEIYDKDLKRSDVNWDKTRIIFISPAFNRFQTDANASEDKPIELWTVKRYSNKTIFFEQIQTEKELQPKEYTSYGVYSEDNHLEKADDSVKSLYRELKNKILSTFTEASVEPKQTYIAFIHRVNFVDIIVQKSNLKLTLNVKQGTLNDPKNLSRDISNVGHFGNGDYEIQIKDNENIEYVIDLIGQSYERN